MRNLREILRLYWDCKLSVNKIHQSIGAARSTIDDHLRRAKAAELTWPLPEELDDVALERMLFPSTAAPKPIRNIPKPEWNYVHTELKKKGVTLSLLWQEYRQDHANGYQYSQYCQIYRDWRKALDLVMRQEHRAGEKVFSDFAGGTLPVTDAKTGEVHQAHIFVAALGASSYTYAEAFFSESTRSWCMGHAHAFSFFGGVPEVTVPDNPKSTVTKPCRYEPDINPDFHHMASYYNCVVIPARVRHPRDKAVVESAVNVATKWILAALRKRTFFSLYELNQAIWQLLEVLNSRPFKKLPGCRRSLFESLDKPALKPLPPRPYEYTEICYARVNIDYHIDYEGHYYSVPYQYVKQRVELRVTSKTIEVFLKGRRIASHQRSWLKGKPTTLGEHMPKSHREYLEWTPSRIISWASKTGVHTARLVEAIMQNRNYPEQAYRSCLGIIRLGKIYGQERLEAACERALAIGGLSYKSVHSILTTGMDRQRLITQEVPRQLKIIHSNIRGSNYYKEDTNAHTPDIGKSEDSQIDGNGESPGGANGNTRH